MRTMEEFLREREALDEGVMAVADRVVRRFYSLDSLAYGDGALDAGTKELMGLAASLVLRCDDCIAWHVGRCLEEGATGEQIVEALGVGMVVGGSVTIPHVRRAVALLGDAPASGGREE